jgi:hypothetical protein
VASAGEGYQRDGERPGDDDGGGCGCDAERDTPTPASAPFDATVAAAGRPGWGRASEAWRRLGSVGTKGLLRHRGSVTSGGGVIGVTRHV